MSSRQQIDSVIDDDDEFCPLCIEEFDLSDKNFKPCPCGYQICQFCYNNIKTHSEEGRCPNCRRSYDDSTIEYKVPNADEFKADLALKHRKAAAAKKKEAEKREIEASSRKNLAGVRVVQKNLVYVIGLNPTIRDENQLLQTLRGRDYFGQYGDIEKIVVSKAKPGGNPNQGIGVYVTFSRKLDAATCIAAVDGSANGDRVLRAQYGTTKYCSSFLRNEQCNNRNCTFLHETGEDSDSYSRQDLSSMNTLSSQRPSHPSARATQPVSHPIRRQPSKDDSISGRPGILDGPALPSSASWANTNAPISRTRRASLTGSQASQSPRPVSATIATSTEDHKRSEKPSPVTQDAQRPSLPPTRSLATASRQAPIKAETPFDSLLKAVTSPDFKFVFSASELSPDEAAMILNYPSFIDPYGGVKRRAMREKVEQERVKREHELLQSSTEDEGPEAGSLQLGGEPEEANAPRGRQSRESHGAIQPPSQQGTADNSTVGSPQQQLMLLKSASNQQAGLADPLSSAALDQAAQVRQGLLHSQMAQFNALQAQNRQSSRFAFANEAGSKNVPNPRLLGQMQSGTPNPLSAPSPQQALAGGFYASGAQGPPPGLKTAGTPPISGGGMFAQGHGFTSNNNLGLGSNIGKQEATPELMRELLRGRGGTNVGGLQGQENTKRESLFPFFQQHNTPSPMTPTNGLLSSFYGPQLGAYPESGGPQKQKKKGKKHRHANTSSGGGGVVDLADPSILQARMHQVGANAGAGQALYGSQGQVDEEFPPLGMQSKERRPVDSFGFLKSSDSSIRAGTPNLPPGLPVPHAHPGSGTFQDHLTASNRSSPAPMPPPGLGGELSSGFGTPKNDDALSRPSTPPIGVNTTRPSSHVKDASQISFGSPVPKSATKTEGRLKDDFSIAPGKIDSAVRLGSEANLSSVEKVNPIKLNTSVGTAQPQEAVSAKIESHPAQASAIGSRPNSPFTTASRISDSSGPRQPRVLRVVDTPKAETPPVPTAPSVASFAGTGGARSRKQSISSNSRPDTPIEFGSEADFYASGSVSRASSPPASNRIGSAPVRAITKSQAKKERRQKAKEAEAKKVETVPAVEETVQAPILGRKRKTKKPANSIVESGSVAADAVPESVTAAKPDKSSPKKNQPKTDSSKNVKEKEELAREAKTPTMPEQPIEQRAPVEEWRSHNTVEQLMRDSEATGISIRDLFLERTKPLHELLAAMHRSEELNLHTSSLFNPANLSQRVDMKCTADDYDLLRHPIELTEDHRKTLLRGEFVRIGTEAKNRCLITPRGCVIPHLSTEEENKYIELEKRMNDVVDPTLDGPDPSNRSGGLEALFATPEKFNICWVDDTSNRLGATSPNAALVAAESPESASTLPPNVLSAMDADTTRTHNWAVANTAELVNSTPAAVRSFAAATAKHLLGGGIASGNNPDLEELAALTDDELKAFAGKSQKDLEGTRKEVDSLDKKFSALLRRNKKLAQQALAIGSKDE
ncbi:hypothetical protein N7510_005645 [Penicillium lagena]|uniref:uncharacterized protein n=1 Tax=Penicillium lagena TaxID=94218 RepID=UPI00253FD6A1|nr:uncharacterized protein N7510_005645 [Penicillium lagena]KAJ5612451.1 hypothetical protein N7510_005645 [Penicillium lagena]